MFQMFSQGPEKSSKLPYSPDFIRLVDEGKIRKAEIVMEVSGSRFVRGELVDLDEKTGKPQEVPRLHGRHGEAQKRLTEKGVQFEVVPQNPYLWQILSGAIPFLLVMGLLYFLFTRQMRMAGKGAMSFGKSRAKLLTRGKNRITFADVAGWRRRKRKCRRSSSSSRIPSASSGWAVAFPRACCWWASRAPARRCWPRPSRARRMSVLQHQRLRLRGDVCGRGRVPRARHVRAGPQERAVHHLH
jgi:hypothetical protein